MIRENDNAYVILKVGTYKNAVIYNFLNPFKNLLVAFT